MPILPYVLNPEAHGPAVPRRLIHWAAALQVRLSATYAPDEDYSILWNYYPEHGELRLFVNTANPDFCAQGMVFLSTVLLAVPRALLAPVQERPPRDVGSLRFSEFVKDSIHSIAYHPN